MLSQPAGTTKANQQISLVIQLFMKTCQEGYQKKMLVDAGILDILAAKLTAIAAADDAVQDAEAKPLGRDQLPRACLPDVLEAIAAIIRDSLLHRTIPLCAIDTAAVWVAQRPDNNIL
jgi:hypothetical protein